MQVQRRLPDLKRAKADGWRRHANPWSVITRLPVPALMALAIFWRDTLEIWLWPVIVLLGFWAVLNPRAFPPPSSTRNWASRSVLGERVWLNRDRLPVPRHHDQWAAGISFLALLSLLPLAHGLYVLDAWETAFGVACATLCNLWFRDRMVWLYEDMRDTAPDYAGWDV